MSNSLAARLLFALPTLALACSSKDAPPAAPPAVAPPAAAPPVAAPSTATPPAPAPSPAGPSDPQIAAIVVAANQVDIDAGEFAARTAAAPAVRELANLMVTDHTAVNQAAVALVTKLGVVPEASDASRGLLAAGAATRAQLAALSGAAFDRAYVDNEVAYHQQVIQVVDDTLVPAARNAELRALLVGVRPALAAHLEHARHVQAALAGGLDAHAGH